MSYLARMIPVEIFSECPSPGEQEIFRRLKDDSYTKDWVVFHSIDLTHHRTQVSGELDFAVIIPGKGVLCLEVKACSRLRRNGGEWYYGNNNKPDRRGPFKQASEAMHSLRNKLSEKRPDLSKIVFWSAVLFPYLNFNEEPVEWHPWQVIDSRGFRAKPLSTLLLGVLEHARKFLEERPNACWYNPCSNEPTIEQCDAIVQALRPNFEYFEAPGARLKRIDNELKFFTQEQFISLDAMSVNPRVLFSGPAGTGKTVLAIEAARRSVAMGERVLFLCFNRFLGKWLEEQLGIFGPKIVVSTLHKYMMSVSGIQEVNSPGRHFWENEIPCAAIEKLLESSQDEILFDKLIVDEAQDVLRDNYLDLLDLSLKGGLATGRWMMFGDFEKQAIYDANVSLDHLKNERVRNAPVYSLRINCRNTPRIAYLVHLLGGLEPGYSKILRPDDLVEPELKYYSSSCSQELILTNILQRLYDEGYKGKQIIVLSPKAEGDCASNVNTKPWKERLKPYEIAGEGHIGFSTIHSFKGLEAPAVILTDIEHISDPVSVALFYIGVTRALQRLVILAHESAKSEVVSTLIR